MNNKITTVVLITMVLGVLGWIISVTTQTSSESSAEVSANSLLIARLQAEQTTLKQTLSEKDTSRAETISRSDAKITGLEAKIAGLESKISGLVASNQKSNELLSRVQETQRDDTQARSKLLASTSQLTSKLQSLGDQQEKDRAEIQRVEQKMASLPSTAQEASPPPALDFTKPWTIAPFRPKEINFELPPLPVALVNLTNKMQEPSQWSSGGWGPVTDHLDWSPAGGPPLWQRELEVIRQQGSFPTTPVPLTNGAVLYSRNLDIFRAASADSSVLEVGIHSGDANRPPFFRFFQQYLPKAKYNLFASDTPASETELAKYVEQAPDAFFKASSTADAVAQEKAAARFEAVDIIIGRAADGIPGQLEAFRFFFVNLLKPGGVYFIEDVDMNFKSTPETDAAAESRTLMIDYLRDMASNQVNHDWRMKTAGEYRADPFVYLWVQDVSCARGGCAVTKRLRCSKREFSLVHKTPGSNLEAALKTARPPPLANLTGTDPSPFTSPSKHLGPVSRPVKFEHGLPLWATEANLFKVVSDGAGSDKSFTGKYGGHQYHAMYAKAFAPWRAAQKAAPGELLRNQNVTQPWKMLEVGLGCGVKGSTPGGGFRLYKQYLPNVEYNVFEFQYHVCAQRYTEMPSIASDVLYLSTHLHEGDQGNYDDLKDCIRHFGVFDVIVDDGSHIASHVISTFREMFIAALKPGGVYVLEDLQTGFLPGDMWGQSPAKQKARLTAIDMVRDMFVSINYPGWRPGYSHTDPLYRVDEPVMNWVEDITCAREACVVYKRVTPLSSQG